MVVLLDWFTVQIQTSGEAVKLESHGLFFIGPDVRCVSPVFLPIVFRLTISTKFPFLFITIRLQNAPVRVFRANNHRLQFVFIGSRGGPGAIKNRNFISTLLETHGGEHLQRISGNVCVLFQLIQQ